MQIINILNGVNPMSSKLSKYLSGILKTKTLKKNEFLLRAGDVCKNVYFVEKGLLRCFSLEDDGTEVCEWFMREDDVVYAVESFLTQNPSTETIQALETCTLYYINYSEVQDIYNRLFPEFNFHRAVLTEKYYLLCIERYNIAKIPDRTLRCHLLLQNHPEYFLRVPHKYIASYLGVSSSTLSRYKKKLKKTGAGYVKQSKKFNIAIRIGR